MDPEVMREITNSIAGPPASLYRRPAPGLPIASRSATPANSEPGQAPTPEVSETLVRANSIRTPMPEVSETLVRSNSIRAPMPDGSEALMRSNSIRALRPDLPSPAGMSKAAIKPYQKVPTAEGLSELTFVPIKAIPEVASTFSPNPTEPGLTKSPGKDPSGLPSFFPALVMPWQRSMSKEEIKKPQEPQELTKPQTPKKIQEALNGRKPHGIYEEEEPTYEVTEEDLWVPDTKIKESMSPRGLYEDDAPLATCGVYEDI